MNAFLKTLFLLPTFLATVLLASALFQRSAMAQQLPPLPLEFSPDNLINPGRPGGRRRGGGSRGNCQADFPLTAITYADSRTVEELGVTRTDETVGALTTQDNPILWFYLPAPVQHTAAELILKDSREQVVFQGLLEGETESSGIVGLELFELLPDMPYQWFLTIDCDESERVTVSGWLEKRSVGLDANRTLMQASDRNRAALYANYGFLQDAVTALAQLRYFSPEDEPVVQDWQQLLTELDLAELGEVPILPCCLVTNSLTPEGAPPTEELPVEVPEPIEVPEPPEAPEMSDPPDEEANEGDDEPEREGRSVLQRARDRGN